MDKVVDYLVYEQSQVRSDRVNRRSFFIIIILIVALVGTNAGWIYYENQFTDVSTTYEAEQKIENGTGNAIITDGVHINGTDNAECEDAATIQLYKNGVAQPQAQSTGSSLAFTTLVQVPDNNSCCPCSSGVSLQVITDTATTFTNANVSVTKVV